jgi:Paired amphipathic helix repeat
MKAYLDSWMRDLTRSYFWQNRFASAPEIYKQFLEILQTYQRESKPIQDVYAQVTQLFNTAPDLLEDFKQFLPESAAQAKQQGLAGRQSADEPAPVSNVRGEPSYPSSNALGQSQTPSRDVKMPPLGQFNVKDSAKEGKKRRAGPGVPGTLGGPTPGPATAIETTRLADTQANRAQNIQGGNANKVSQYSLGHIIFPNGAGPPVNGMFPGHLPMCCSCCFFHISVLFSKLVHPPSLLRSSIFPFLDSVKLDEVPYLRPSTSLFFCNIFPSRCCAASRRVLALGGFAVNESLAFMAMSREIALMISSKLGQVVT